MTELEAILILNKVSGCNASTIAPLVSCFGSFKDILDQRNLAAIKQQSKFGFTLSRKLEEVVKKYNPSDEIKNLERNNVEIVPFFDNRYPSKLLNIYDPPICLFVKGKTDFNNQKVISIVGSRRASVYGREMAEEMAREFAEQGIIVISGLARGIDSFAHKGAMNGNGYTIGVLGCGIDIVYPLENKKLYALMEQDGTIVSEHSLGVKPMPFLFPKRNRIISGMSDAVVVVEAAKKSGSLITANCALEQGKDVFCLPAQATSFYGEGSNNLIREGAALVTSSKDVLTQLYPEDNIEQSASRLNPTEKAVLNVLKSKPTARDEISVQSNVEVNELCEVLLKLELSHLIKKDIGGYVLCK